MSAVRWRLRGAMGLCLLIGSARTSGAQPTAAAAATESLVRRRDGSSFVGVVTPPGDVPALSLRLPTGEVVLIPSAEVESIAPLPPVLALPAALLTRVRLDSDQATATLERQELGGPEPAWRPVCGRPCGLRLDNR